uniref:Uncharacterized protein n=1 Tax=uncultured Desulfobacterium sp. TaxID=201089 RepID=E1YE30_9BACT|nr:unknown protein [uncultured Desulfobacterium sp.]
MHKTIILSTCLFNFNDNNACNFLHFCIIITRKNYAAILKEKIILKMVIYNER